MLAPVALVRGCDKCHSSSVKETHVPLGHTPRGAAHERTERSTAQRSRSEQARRVLIAAKRLHMHPRTFIAWFASVSGRGDPVDGWSVPWLVDVTTATRFRRDAEVVSRLRTGWRLIVTFHGKPFAVVIPLPEPDSKAQFPSAERRRRGQPRSDAEQER